MENLWRFENGSKVFLTANFGDKKKKQVKISQKDFDYILDLLKQSEKGDRKIEALDGSVWAIKRYQGKTLVWERKIGYIYGIRSLETLSGFLYKLAGMKNINW